MAQKVLGKTAGEVIRDRKLLEAKRMLVNLDLNVSEIAYQLNFSDSSHFSKFFKKHTGRSPEEFRKSAFLTE
jgi:AraC-like DNA-binding protein